VGYCVVFSGWSFRGFLEPCAHKALNSKSGQERIKCAFCNSEPWQSSQRFDQLVSVLLFFCECIQHAEFEQALSDLNGPVIKKVAHAPHWFTVDSEQLELPWIAWYTAFQCQAVFLRFLSPAQPPPNDLGEVKPFVPSSALCRTTLNGATSSPNGEMRVGSVAEQFEGKSHERSTNLLLRADFPM